jgi:UDP-N-acetyl-D-mannosaminuronic acid dehydrogenase
MIEASQPSVVVVGGCGRVGLPLSLAFADRSVRSTAYDIDTAAVAAVCAGQLPFAEPGAAEVLDRVLRRGTFRATSDPACVRDADVVVIVVGTAVDEHLHADPDAIPNTIAALSTDLRDGQLIVLCSTTPPGVTRVVQRMIERLGLDIDVAFCPERIAEGQAMTELYELPQIVSGCTQRAEDRAAELFHVMTDDIVRLAPEEAELAKLFTNTWRYITFAAANQMYMVANDLGLDFERIRQAVVHDYPRASGMPGAGFAAGPCLLKDAMQVAAVTGDRFSLGQASMLINEGLPSYVIAQLDEHFDLRTMTVGILGMAFKAGSDDTRARLSYKLRDSLRPKAAVVLCTDPFVTSDDQLVPLERVLTEADLVVIGAPHSCYRGLAPVQPAIDIWGILGGGVRC